MAHDHGILHAKDRDEIVSASYRQIIALGASNSEMLAKRRIYMKR